MRPKQKRLKKVISPSVPHFVMFLTQCIDIKQFLLPTINIVLKRVAVLFEEASPADFLEGGLTSLIYLRLFRLH